MTYKGMPLVDLPQITDAELRTFKELELIACLEPYTVDKTIPVIATNKGTVSVLKGTKSIVSVNGDHSFKLHTHPPIWKGTPIDISGHVHAGNESYVAYVDKLNLDHWQDIEPVPRNEEGNERTLICMHWRGVDLHIGTVPLEVTRVSSFNIEPSFPIAYKPCTWFGKPVHVPCVPIPNAAFYAYVPNGCELEKKITIYEWLKGSHAEKSVLLTVNEHGVTVPLGICERVLPTQFNLVENFHVLFTRQPAGFETARKRTTTDVVPIDNPTEHADFAAWFDTLLVHPSYEDRAYLAFRTLLKDIPSTYLVEYLEELSVMYNNAERARIGYTT